MRPFRLKRTITHVTVLSALLPAATALSHQVQIPIGLNATFLMAAGSTAVLGHQVTPEGAALRDPASAPARGGYVYDAFDRVIRSGVNGECVKHGLWTPELATPACEPWLFGAPAAKQPAPAPAVTETKPAPAPAPAPAAKVDEGFPEWIGPDEFRVGVVPLWPENEFDSPDNISQPRMFFDAPEEEDAAVDTLISEPRMFGDDHEDGVDDADLVSQPRMFGDEVEHEGSSDDLISAPIMHGEIEEFSAPEDDLLSPPVVYYDGGDGRADGDDLISAPRYYDDAEIGGGPTDEPAPTDGANKSFKEEGTWPTDPYAGEFMEDQPLQEPDTPWSAGSDDSAQVAPGTGMSDFAAQEENWPVDRFAEGFIEEQAVAEGDDSWVIPSPVAGAGEETVGPFEEDGRDPEEAISNPVMYFDLEDQGIIPPENIIGHTLVQTEGDDDSGVQPDDHIIGHTLIQGDGHEDSGAPVDDHLIGHAIYGDDDSRIPPDDNQTRTSIFGDDGSDRPTPDDNITGHAVYGDDGSDRPAPTDDLVSAPKVYEDATAAAPAYDGSEFSTQAFPDDASPGDDEEGEPYTSYYSDAAPAAPAAESTTAPAPDAPAESAPAYGHDDEDGDEQDEDGDFVSDYSKVPTARGALDNLPAHRGVQPSTAAASPDGDVPAYGAAEDEEEAEEEPFAPDYSKVPTAQGALDNLPLHTASKPAATTTPAPTAPTPPAAKQDEHLMTVVLSADALFEFDRYALRKGSNKSLREFATGLKQIKWGQITVVGHTDRLGSDKYNQRLSERRAQTIRRELIKLGVDGRKVKAIGRGKAQPITTDCIGEKRSKELIECLAPDRRVEIFVDEKQEIIITKPAAAPKKKK